ncbi:TonB family protein [Novosphingobium sp. KACC 22771]|uniref:TonB family protein n=1 Tax=Novosphingobium sp. KACC 22771 TaxID=3025670 RepID=UPI00236729EF|nr:TonB family protein [Novosphingobium sp. KACC 22771]WDF70929.1 TonB family protein [Novosphingobium sp. KACC 22771]
MSLLHPCWLRPLAWGLVLAGHGALAALFLPAAPSTPAMGQAISVALVLPSADHGKAKAEQRPAPRQPQARPHQASHSAASPQAVSAAALAPAGSGSALSVSLPPASPVSAQGDSAQRADTPATGCGKPDYGTLVALELNRLKRYPATARAAHISGAVTFAYVVDAKGRITRTDLVRSSGYGDIDEAAAALFDAAHLPPPPEGQFRSTVTIRYALTER